MARVSSAELRLLLRTRTASCCRLKCFQFYAETLWSSPRRCHQFHGFRFSGCNGGHDIL